MSTATRQGIQIHTKLIAELVAGASAFEGERVTGIAKYL